jgi:hypothetical protein
MVPLHIDREPSFEFLDAWYGTICHDVWISEVRCGIHTSLSNLLDNLFDRRLTSAGIEIDGVVGSLARAGIRRWIERVPIAPLGELLTVAFEVSPTDV